MKQVITNLFNNAWESIGDKEGTIHLTVKTVLPSEIPKAYRLPVDWQPIKSAHICLEVADKGCGIMEKDIYNIFDPYFSTKFTGRGLGLSVVLGIVRTHEGGIRVESAPGRGSVFSVFLPKYEEEVPKQPKKQILYSEFVESSTVLLVDDEEVVRKTSEKILIRLGFKVFLAKEGGEAVELFSQHKDEINCVICDLTMPRMNGWETIAALRKISPDIPVILSSGYDESGVMASEHSEKPQAFLGKPYQIQELRNAIQLVIR